MLPRAHDDGRNREKDRRKCLLASGSITIPATTTSHSNTQPVALWPPPAQHVSPSRWRAAVLITAVGNRTLLARGGDYDLRSKRSFRKRGGHIDECREVIC